MFWKVFALLALWFAALIVGWAVGGEGLVDAILCLQLLGGLVIGTGYLLLHD